VANGGIPRQLAREVRAIAGGHTETHRHLRERIAAIVLVSVVVDAIGTLLVLLFEHDAPRTEITNIGDALFWTTAQLLTVSSQMANPISTGGRIVDVVLELYAITVVATLAGSFGAFFHRRGVERAPIEPGKDAAGAGPGA
jgi:hypothetical protein